MIIGEPVQKRIRVSVFGQNPKELMAIIRSHFDHIHNTLNLEKNIHLVETVLCICSECKDIQNPYFLKYDYLRRLAAKGLNARCENTLEEILAEKLLDRLRPIVKTFDLYFAIITILSKLQGISAALPKEENCRNSIMSQLLESSGFRVKDQTLWGRSAKGIEMGELDIKIEDDAGRALSIIKAFNLTGWNKTEIENHIKKIFNYDCNGLKQLYIVVLFQQMILMVFATDMVNIWKLWIKKSIY